MRKKLSRFNPTDRIVDKLTEFLALRVRDDRAQVLNLHHPLPHEDNLRYRSNAGVPGVAEELRIQS